DPPEEQQRQYEAWLTIQRGHAVANGLPVISVNRTGYEADPSGHTGGIQFWGQSFVAGPQGELLYTAPAQEEATQVVSIDRQWTEEIRRIWPFFRDRRIDAYHGLTKRYLD
ncbi:MAG: nitrilase-related carbon-nitrogen hydrolase, partial [Bacteroidota bacterium]